MLPNSGIFVLSGFQGEGKFGVCFQNMESFRSTMMSIEMLIEETIGLEKILVLESRYAEIYTSFFCIFVKPLFQFK